MKRVQVSGAAMILVSVCLLTICEVRAQKVSEAPSANNKTNDRSSISNDDQAKATSQFPLIESSTGAFRGEDKKSSHSFRSALLRPLPLPDVKKLSELDKAYLDVYLILSEDNKCSRFYGGAAALEVLNELTRQIKPAYFDKSIALRMTGNISYYSNNTTGLSYRLFESAQLNTNGPFYRTSVLSLDSFIHRVGEFSSNTREARITIVLHEIGHMIMSADRQWVLPNDGNNPTISKSNTQRVIDVCRNEIVSRGHVRFDQALAAIRGFELQSHDLASATAPPPTNTNSGLSAPARLRQIGSQPDAHCEFCRSEIQIPQDY
ncbi:MAG TPA: hypothetical protein VGN86_10955 [Pyrinomonadaceae bacterium]|jgi:hypothetical protein|nr:hypothetical protein [Pyrinomonadaceae bacterium]